MPLSLCAPVGRGDNLKVLNAGIGIFSLESKLPTLLHGTYGCNKCTEVVWYINLWHNHIKGTKIQKNDLPKRCPDAYIFGKT